MAAWARRVAAGLAFLALTAGPAGAQAPGAFAQEMARDLARADAVLARQGFSRAAGPFSGALQAHTSRRAPITLRAGGDYRIVGVCDRRCADVDLRVLDPYAVVMGEDVLPDALPVVGVRPAMTGRYEIEVEMARCADGPCFYAFSVYAR